MSKGHFFFAGGGTGGHIYPAIAVAEAIKAAEPAADIHFFCSSRPGDEKILSKTGFAFTALPAKGFSLRPDRLTGFFASFLASSRIAGQAMGRYQDAVVIGSGGFVAAPVCLAAYKLKVPTALLNVDIVPGKANKLIARWLPGIEVFVQFADTVGYFKKTVKVHTVGCPLRTNFSNPDPGAMIKELGLDKDKKTLVITGASSGSQNINIAVCSLLDRLDSFAESWQIVHLAGRGNFEDVKNRYAGAKISCIVLDYCDNMSDLLACADLVIGRSGAVSVAEYMAAGVPSICMPYPYHRDRHQYLNAGKLVDAGAAVIVDDVADQTDRCEWLWEELEALMKDSAMREEMRANCRKIANIDAGRLIARRLLEMAAGR